MNKKHILVAILLLTLPFAWIFCASLVFCLFTKQIAAFNWPFDQWLPMADEWRANWAQTLDVVTSGLVPTLVTAAMIKMMWRRSRSKSSAPPQSKLYGATDWASDSEERSNGFRRKGSLF